MSQRNVIDYKQNRTKNLLLSGLFAALTAVCSWITLPLFFTPVPIPLALIGPYMAGLLLGYKYGFLSQVIFVMLGALGLPVFSGFTGGLGIIAGPTGGFIAGYILCAIICGLPLRSSDTKYRIGLMVIGLISCYSCGIVWFMILTNSTLWASLVACVFPFLLGDVVKIALATILTKYLYKAVAIR